MDQYRAVSARMSENEMKVLNHRNDELRAIQMGSALATVALSIFSFGLLGWVFTITQRTISEEKVRVAVLNGLNEGLSKEVEERKKAEESLKETTAKLLSSNTDLQQFAYVASHDLQEPLRAVAGFLSLLSKKHVDSFDDESKQWITHSVEGAQRMRSLINDLLSYARLETRGKAFEHIDTRKVLQQAQTDLKVAIEEADAEINVGDLPVVNGDNSQLTQLFQNLLGNAIKFRGSDKPKISISAVEKDEFWQFAIRDNGIGFDMEHAARIFVIFQRLQGREEYRGTGIGLALCKKIVDRHGGTIWAESEVGKGSTFYFTIPTLHGENHDLKTD
jgi:light-regulated signal transduction histidine kinase (bacteriophytochrome)